MIRLNNFYHDITRVLVGMTVLFGVVFLGNVPVADANCQVSQEEIDRVLADGIDWDADVTSADFKPGQEAAISEIITNYLCAGIEPEDIQVRESGEGGDHLNICLEDAQYYPASQNQCFYSCYVDPWGLGNRKWTTGDACRGVPIEDQRPMFVVVNPPEGTGAVGGCYVGANARGDCLKAQAAYGQAGLLDNAIGGQCQDKSYVTTASAANPSGRVEQYCFDYQTKNEPEKPFEVGRGLEDCLVADSFSSVDSCAAKMIQRYPQEGDSIRRSPEDYCSPKSFSQSSVDCNVDPFGCQADPSASVTRYCMNDEGLIGLTDQQIAERERDAVERARIEAEQARLAELAKIEAARVAAIAQQDAELQQSDSLVPCVGGSADSCGWEDLIQLANNVIGFIIRAAAVIMVIVILMAGWGLITAQGNSSAWTEARGKLTKAIIGFAIVLSAWLIVETVMSALLSQEFQDDKVIDLLDE